MKQFFFVFILTAPLFLAAQPNDNSATATKVDSLLQSAISLISQRELEEALTVIEVAKKLALEEFGKDHPIYADCLFQEGRIYHNTNKAADAERIYLQVKNIRESAFGNEHLEYAAVLANLGLLYFRMGRYDEADSLYLIVKDIRADKLGTDHLDYAAILSNLGILYLRMDRFDEAEQYHLKAKAIRADKLGENSAEYIGTINNLGSVCYWSGRYEEAEEYYLKVKNWRKTNLGTDHIEYAHILSNMANLYADMNRYEEAERFYAEILNIQEKSLGKESEDYGWTLSYLGLMCVDLGRYEEAEKYLLEATSNLGNVFGLDHFEYASSLERLATLYHTLGLYDAASPLYEQAKNIREKVFDDEHTDYANALNNLAILYEDMGKGAAAEPLYLQAKDIFGNIGKENPGYVWTLNNLAILYKNQGRYAPAETLLKEAMGIREKTLGNTHPDYANTLEDLALVFQKTDSLKQALDFQTQAHQVFSQSYGKKHVRYAQSAGILASMFSDAGQPIDAAPLYLESNAIQREELVRSTRFLSQRELPKYIRQFENFLDGFYAFSQKNRKAMPQLSDACFDNALFHKGFILTAANQINRLAQTDPASQKKYELLKSYHRRIADELAKPANERQNLEQLETTANTLEKEMVQLVKDLGQVVQQVTVQQIQELLKDGEAIIEFIDYQSSGVGDSVQYAALVLTKKGFGENGHSLFVPLCNEKPLKSLLHIKDERKADFVHALYSSDDRGATPLGEKLPSLYDLIWAPIEAALQGADLVKSGDEKLTIYFSPSGLLNRLNIGAIPIGEEMVLGDQYNLIRLGSSRSLLQGDQQSVAIQTAALMGGLEYEIDTSAMPSPNIESTPLLAVRNLGRAAIPSDTLSRSYLSGTWEFLNSAKKEVENIGNIMSDKGISANIYKGHSGTEELFKTFGNGQPSPNILHLATHGFFFSDPNLSKGEGDSAISQSIGEGRGEVFKLSDNPMMRSGLILSDGGYAWKNGTPPSQFSEDGILTAYEISQMNLSNTELVVLSACETGLGDIVGDEGVFGLQRAFKIAGAKYLIMSLWQVPDRQTSILMTTFYKKWLEEKMTIPDAFHNAQKELRDFGLDPYQWAGFVLVE